MEVCLQEREELMPTDEDDAFHMLEIFNHVRDFVGPPDLSQPIQAMTFDQLQLEYNKSHPPISSACRHWNLR